jgi:hypothetical protein
VRARPSGDELSAIGIDAPKPSISMADAGTLCEKYLFAGSGKAADCAGGHTRGHAHESSRRQRMHRLARFERSPQMRTQFARIVPGAVYVARLPAPQEWQPENIDTGRFGDAAHVTDASAVIEYRHL